MSSYRLRSSTSTSAGTLGQQGSYTSIWSNAGPIFPGQHSVSHGYTECVDPHSACAEHCAGAAGGSGSVGSAGGAGGISGGGGGIGGLGGGLGSFPIGSGDGGGDGNGDGGDGNGDGGGLLQHANMAPDVAEGQQVPNVSPSATHP